MSTSETMKEQDNILVLGAGGNIGGKTAQELIAKGAQVGVVGRSASRLHRFEGKAAIWEGDFDDDFFLREVLREADSLFLTVPENALQNIKATAKRLANLLEDTLVTHVVNISNGIIKKAGAPTRLVALEEALNEHLPQHLLHLRCGNFFENLNWGLHTPYKPDLELPYVSSYEVAAVAAKHLQRRDFIGKQVKVLLGERDYSMAALAAAAGVSYQQLPYSVENISFYKPFNDEDFEVAPRSLNERAEAADERFTLEYFLQRDLKSSTLSEA